MAKRRRPPQVSVAIAIVREGIPYTGSYTVEKGIVTVIGIVGTKTTQLGRSDPKGLAEMLLAELVAEHVAKISLKP